MREIMSVFGLSKNAIDILSIKLKELFFISINLKKEIVFLCLGTDKVLGDCLGTLVGEKLLKNSLPFWVYGTLQKNITAKNLEQTLKYINTIHSNARWVVIDTLATTNKIDLGTIVLSDTYKG